VAPLTSGVHVDSTMQGRGVHAKDQAAAINGSLDGKLDGPEAAQEPISIRTHDLEILGFISCSCKVANF
jgi:hypothetical protein